MRTVPVVTRNNIKANKTSEIVTDENISLIIIFNYDTARIVRLERLTKVGIL